MSLPDLATTRRGLLVILSGPSGVGKDVAIGRLKQLGFDIHYVITATTRRQRPNEEHGVDYFFVTPAEFQRMIDHDELLEWSVVHGNRYGPPIAQIVEKLAAGQDVLLKIDVQGARKVKSRSRDGIFIFLAPPSIEDLVRRLRERNTDSEEDVRLRVANAALEMEALSDYDYVVINRDGQLDRAVDDIRSIITAERLRVHPRHADLLPCAAPPA
jgi:guanylate kinase